MRLRVLAPVARLRAVAVVLLLSTSVTTAVALAQSDPADTCPAKGPDGQTDDADDDNVVDVCDDCPGTEPTKFAVANASRILVDFKGCAIVQACPCAGPRPKTADDPPHSWKRRRNYVRCALEFVRRLRHQVHPKRQELRELRAVAKASNCGKRRRKTGDRDGDGILDDGDGSGFAGDHRCHGGNRTNCDDNCPRRWNPAQRDINDDGQGDKCDHDNDGDGFKDWNDNCKYTANPDQADDDDDGVGDVCDQCPDSDEDADVNKRGCE